MSVYHSIRSSIQQTSDEIEDQDGLVVVDLTVESDSSTGYIHPMIRGEPSGDLIIHPAYERASGQVSI